jgi:hypothetical protein
MGLGKKYKKTCQSCQAVQTMQSGYMRPWTCDKCSERFKAYDKGQVRTVNRPCGCEVKEYQVRGIWTHDSTVYACGEHGPDWRFH